MCTTHTPEVPIDPATFLAQHAPHVDLARLATTACPLSHLTVVLNPSAGSRRARQLWSNLVRPLLSHFLSHNNNSEWLGWDGGVQETQDVRDGERIGREIATQATEGRKEVVMVFGGDGTIHEVLNGVSVREDGSVREHVEVELVLLPTGTANALYNHFFPPESSSYPSTSPTAPLYSLLSFLDPSSSSPHPLPLALNTLPHPSSPVLTTVVSSAALHACLLHTADVLRHTRPELEGTERFKVAAQREAGRWWDGRLFLHGRVKLYNPSTKAWVDQGTEEGVVEGPFSYLVSTLVSRFEPTFVVAPFRSPLSPLAPAEGEASIDLILIRPLRRAETRALVKAGRLDDARSEFVGQLWEVTGGMYEGGKHVDAVYDDGESVVEVWRCEGFEWVPDTQVSPSASPCAAQGSQESSDSDSALKSRLVCLDGALHDLGLGGSLRVEAVAGSGVKVWA
ncbi:sphingosine kinase 1 [Rhodotorula toruloides]|uniref:Sphingosine kinase 1 n=1 Tax=Rhodotorula toruloides TaxID=5286 RepID=A0A511KEZ5_RHOTO|nr:sphingosine kinase 1 [Rhodotorula toruloides]